MDFGELSSSFRIIQENSTSWEKSNEWVFDASDETENWVVDDFLVLIQLPLIFEENGLSWPAYNAFQSVWKVMKAWDVYERMRQDSSLFHNQQLYRSSKHRSNILLAILFCEKSKKEHLTRHFLISLRATEPHGKYLHFNPWMNDWEEL